MSEAPDRIAAIDLGAIRTNFRLVRELAGPDVRILPAVKADAYGHGAAEVSAALAYEGADGFCVAALSEVAAVRQASGDRPVVLLGASLPQDAPEICESGAECVVASLEFARALSTEASKQQKTVRVHFKVDTGMGRIGFRPEEAASAAAKLAGLHGIELSGVMTHFPSADDSDRSFTQSQIASFSQVADAVQQAAGKRLLVHAANSAGILRFPKSRFDAVRPGIMLYGCRPGLGCDYPGVGLAPAMTLASRIVFLKTVQAGQTVSYGRTWTAAGKRTIATVSLGYGDGLPRALSNIGSALVRGKLVTIAGRVCMDQTMLDVTDTPDAALGDEVVFWGKQGDAVLRADEVADSIGTIAYELTCRVTSRVPRRYIGQ